MTIEHIMVDDRSNKELISMFASPAFNTMLEIARAKRDEALISAAESQHRIAFEGTNEKAYSEALYKSALDWDSFISFAKILAEQKEPFTTIKVVPTPT